MEHHCLQNVDIANTKCESEGFGYSFVKVELNLREKSKRKINCESESFRYGFVKLKVEVKEKSNVKVKVLGTALQK